MASQTHSPLTEFSGRGSCRDCPSHPRRRRHRTEGFPTNYWGARIRVLLDTIHVNTFNLIRFSRCWTAASILACTYSIYIMTPIAQQSTGLPYLCLPTTSGAESKERFIWFFSWFSSIATAKTTAATFNHVCLHFRLFTKIFRSPTGVLNESIFKFRQLEVADNNFGVLQTIKIHQILQLHE